MKSTFTIILSLIIVTLFAVSIQAQIPTSGLRLHLKADAGTSSTTPGQKISQWNDQSGNGFHATEGNSTWQPTYVNDGGIPAVRFTPSAPTSMNLPRPSDMGFYLTNYEFFIVTKTSSTATQFPLAGGINYQEIQTSGASGARFIARSGNYIDNPARVDDGGFHILNAIGTTSEATLGVDGVFATLLTDATTSVDVAFNLGTRSDGFYRFDGDIAEVIMYNRKLSVSESMQVTEYLKNKYATPFTAYGAPQTQASGLNFTGVTQSSMNVNLTKGSGTHRVVVAKKSGAVSVGPTNGVAYSGSSSFGAGSHLGDGNYVIYAGTEGTSTALSGLEFNESYHFSVFEYYVVGGVPQYGSALNASQTTVDLTQASSLTISSRSADSFTAGVAAGSGTYRLIVARAGSAVNQGPSNGLSYTGNANYGSGTQIGTGNFVVYNGTDGSSFSLNALEGNMVYYLAAFEYQIYNGVPKYQSESPAVNSGITYPSSSASNIQFSSVGLDQMAVSFTAGNGQKRIVIAREGLAVSALPSDGQSYSANTTLCNGQNLGSGNYVVYDGTGNSFTLTGLTNSTSYHFSVYEYNEYNGTINFKTTVPAVGSQSTTVVPLPTASIGSFSNNASTSVTIVGTVNPNGYENSVRAVYGTDPGSLTNSTSPVSIGSGSIDVPVSINLTGLTVGELYYVAIKATNIRGDVVSGTHKMLPLNRTAMSGWYRADYIETIDNTFIPTLIDASGLGNNSISRSNAAYLKTNRINGKPTIDLSDSGAGNHFNLSTINMGIKNHEFELFIVFKSSNNLKMNLISRNGSVASYPRIILNNNSPVSGIEADMYGYPLSDGAQNDFTNDVAHVVHYKTHSSKTYLRVDNHAPVIGNFYSPIEYDEISIGSSIFNKYLGEIAEIVIYNEILSAEQRAELATYLSTRYSITQFVPSAPTTEASNLQFSSVQPTSFSVSMDAGNGTERLIVARLSSSPKTAPTNGVIYTANATFGNGSNLGNGNFVVGKGIETSVAISGLAAYTEYVIDVYEYNLMELDPLYLPTSTNSAAQTTLNASLPALSLFRIENPNTTTPSVRVFVNPEGFETTAQVFYGTSSDNLNLSTVSQVVGSQSTVQSVGINLSGISSNTTYYYKVVATNFVGSVESEVASFTNNSLVGLSSLQFWVSSDVATNTANSGDPVTNWGNQAGKAIKATQELSQYKPTRITESGVSFLRFDGDNSVKFMEIGFADSLQLVNSEYEIFIVAKSSSANIGFLIGGTVGNFELHTRPGGGVGTRFIPKSGIILDNTINTTDGNFHIFNAKATSTQAELRVDGNSTIVNGDARSSIASQMLIGARRDGSYPFDGDIAEIIIFNTELTESQAIFIEYYLAGKYGISMSKYVVNSTNDTNTGSGNMGTLRYVMNKINSDAPNSMVELDMSYISGTITLTSDLPSINYDVTFSGPGKDNLSISGNDLHRPFFIGSGLAPFTAENPANPTVIIKEITISNGLGKGGNGESGGGGAAGMGGAIFINKGIVRVENVRFSQNSAVGGIGSYGGNSGNGGGFGGDAVWWAPGGSGFLGGVIPTYGSGQNGGVGSGGASAVNNAGSGGFGGGGGSVKNLSLSYVYGGMGGFGGGGGGAFRYGVVVSYGAGGFAAGNGNSNESNYPVGGGGAGLGGAIFNRFGQLLISNSQFDSNSATGGTSYLPTSNGSSYAGAIFNYEGSVTTIETSFTNNSAENSSNQYSYSNASQLNLITVTKPSSLTLTTATLNASILTYNLSGSYVFKYGTTRNNLTNSTSSQSFNAQPGAQTVSESLSSLDLSTILYVSAELTNALGTFVSDTIVVFYNDKIPNNNLNLWLSAGRGTQTGVGSIVSEWNDYSGLNNNANQTASGFHPILVENAINGEPVIRFNGSTSYLLIDNASSLEMANSDYEIFMVAQSNSSATQFLWSGGISEQEIHLNGSSGVRFLPTTGKIVDAGTNGQFTNGQAFLVNVKATDTNGSIRFNNNLLGVLTQNSHTSNSNQVLLGIRTGGSLPYNGDIAEVIAYNKALSVQERDSVNTYLSTKYGIALETLIEPTINASNSVLLQKQPSSLQFAFTKGNGAKRLVLAKANTAVDAFPVDLTAYTTNAAFGIGTEIGTENFVVYNGTDTTFTITGLSAASTYHFAVFEYNGLYDTDFLTSSNLTFSARTFNQIPSAIASSSLKFYGSDEVLTIPHDAAFNSDAVTLELWFKPQNVGAVPFLISKANEEMEIHLVNSNRSIRFISTTNVYIDSPVNAFEFDAWNHIAVSYKPSEMIAKMWINGIEVTVTNNGGNPLSHAFKHTTSPLLLGQRSGYSLPFSGEIDEVRIWNDVRTTEEVRENMFSPITSDFNNLVAYYQFNEGTGTTTVDAALGLNGTLSGFEFDVTNGWRDSGIPFGSGTFSASDAITSGTINLSGLNITLTENFDNSVTVLSNQFTVEPLVGVSGNMINLNNPYWVVESSTNAGSFEASLTFTAPTNFVNTGTIYANQFKLFTRPFGSDGAWTLLQSSAASVSSNSITFNGITAFGQFALGRDVTYEYQATAGKSVLFDGTNDFVSIPLNSGLTSTKLTMEFWFKWNRSGSAVDFITSRGSEEWEIHLGSVSNRIRFIPRTGVYIDTPAEAIVPGQWTHLAVVYDPTQSLGKIYLNGLDATGNVSGSLDQALLITSNALNLGRRQISGDFNFSGELDEFRVWNSARTQQQIQENMSRTLPDAFYSDLVMYFQFNEGSGALISEIQNGLTGTLTNFDYNQNSGWVNSLIPITQEITTDIMLTGTEGWRLLASPISANSYTPLLSSIWTQGFEGAFTTSGSPNVYVWPNSATGNSSASWTPLTTMSSPMQAGSGVLVYVYSDDNGPAEGNAGFPKTIAISGTEMGEDKNLSGLLNQNVGGWTLLGNPFSKDISWNNLSRNGLAGSVYVWDNEANTWRTWNGSTGGLTNGHVGAFNGFFVETTSLNPTFMIPQNARVDGNNGFVGKGSTQERIALALELKTESGLTNQAWFEFTEAGQTGKDDGDTYKLAPLSYEWAQLASVSKSILNEDILLDVNNLPVKQNQWNIPLAISSTEFGKHELKIQTNSLPEGWKVRLWDSFQEISIDLNDPFVFELEVNVNAAANEEHIEEIITDEAVRLSTKTRPESDVRASAQKTGKVAAKASQKNAEKNKMGPEIQSGNSLSGRYVLQITKSEFADNGNIELPTQVELSQNYPNPFNPSTTIQFALPENAQVRLDVFDITGRLIKTEVNEERTAGYHSVQINASELSSGLYFYRLRTVGKVVTKKMMLIK